jgi:hypothetical protein
MLLAHRAKQSDFMVNGHACFPVEGCMRLATNVPAGRGKDLTRQGLVGTEGTYRERERRGERERRFSGERDRRFSGERLLRGERLRAFLSSASLRTYRGRRATQRINMRCALVPTRTAA